MTIFAVLQGGPNRTASSPGDIICAVHIAHLILQLIIRIAFYCLPTHSCLKFKKKIMINNIIGSQRAEKLEEARAPKRIRNKQTVDQARYK